MNSANNTTQNTTRNTTPKTILGVILAGGGSMRMGNGDKAEVLLDGTRLIDRVMARISPQVPSVVISGPQDYGLGVPTVPDRGRGAEGPVAGIVAVAEWAAKHAPDIEALLTVPVDSPFLPLDLCARLSCQGGAAIAHGDGRLQPAFGYWPLKDIAANAALLNDEGWLSLQRLAKACDATTIDFDDGEAFVNINTPEDLARIANSSIRRHPRLGPRPEPDRSS